MSLGDLGKTVSQASSRLSNYLGDIIGRIVLSSPVGQQLRGKQQLSWSTDSSDHHMLHMKTP